MNSKPFGKRKPPVTCEEPEKAKASDWLALGLLVSLLTALFTTQFWMPAANGFVGFICKVIDFSEVESEAWGLRSSYSYADRLDQAPVNSTTIGMIIAIAIAASLLLCIVAHYKTKRQFKDKLSPHRRRAVGLS